MRKYECAKRWVWSEKQHLAEINKRYYNYVIRLFTKNVANIQLFILIVQHFEQKKLKRILWYEQKDIAKCVPKEKCGNVRNSVRRSKCGKSTIVIMNLALPSVTLVLVFLFLFPFSGFDVIFATLMWIRWCK